MPPERGAPASTIIISRPFVMPDNDPTHDTPKFPNELLTEIFRHCLAIPYKIESSDLASDGWWASKTSIEREGEHRRLMMGMSGGWGLGYVCKTWYILLVPFMFEWITVHRHETLETLLELLSHPPGWERDVDSNNIGWYTKRLDINFRKCKTRGRLAERTLAAIFQSLPNLEVLTISTNSLFKRRHMDRQMLSVISPKLKIIVWVDGDRYTPKEEDWPSFMISHPSLTEVKPPSPFCRWMPPNDSSQVIAPSLQHICVCTNHRDCGRNLMGPLPSLKRVTIRGFWSQITLEPEVVNSLMRHRATLTLVQFNIRHLSDLEHVAILRPLFNNSPHLRRIDLVLSWLFDYPSAQLHWQFPPSITEIGVRIVNRNYPTKGGTLQFFFQITHLSRGLEKGAAMIHFLDDLNVQHVLLRRRILAEKRGLIITSFRRPSGEVVDLLSLANADEAESVIGD